MNQVAQHQVPFPRKMKSHLDNLQENSLIPPDNTPSNRNKYNKVINLQQVKLKEEPNFPGSSEIRQTSPQFGNAKIIVNINGTTNINNFHNFSLSQQSNIKGRKIDMPQLRVGQNMEESFANPANQPPKNNSKFIQKKVLQQAMKSAKNSRVTHKGLMQSTLKSVPNKHNEGMKQFLQQTHNFTTSIQSRTKSGSGMVDKQKLKQSQTQQLNLRDKRNGTQQTQSNVGQSMHNVTSDHGTLNLSKISSGAPRPGRSSKNQNSMVKSNRTMVQVKQSTMTRHKRTKSEVKKQNYATNPAPTASGSRAANQSAQYKKIQNKKVRQMDPRRKSAEYNTTQNTQYQRQKAGTVVQQNEAISISSFSSGEKGDTSLVNIKTGSHGQSLQQRLKNNYFINSKQLLRHLSPLRQNEMSGSGEDGQRQDSRKIPPNSQCALQKPVPMQREQHHKQRIRSTSTAGKKAQIQTQPTANFSSSRRAQSLSQSRDSGPSGGGNNQLNVLNAKYEQPKSSFNIAKVDKIVKENIRKNKTKQNEESLKRQQEDLQQKKKQQELTRLNHQVRMINASKIVNHMPQDKKNLDSDYMMSYPQGQISGLNSNSKRRSQSAIEGLNLSGSRRRQASSGDRRTHHSQGMRAGQKPAGRPDEQTKKEPQKVIPNTTKNTTENKPRSFVEEIYKLNSQIQREIGRTTLRNEPMKQQLNLAKIQTAEHQRDDSTNRLNKTAATHKMLNQTKILDQKAATAKRHSKKHSVQVQKYIERKKKQQQIKKSMELTIEVGKQLQIQKNLFRLENFVKKHNRQRSQPAVDKPKNTVPKRSRRHKNAQSTIVDITNLKNMGLLAEHPTPSMMINENSEKDYQSGGDQTNVFIKAPLKKHSKIPNTFKQKSKSISLGMKALQMEENQSYKAKNKYGFRSPGDKKMSVQEPERKIQMIDIHPPKIDLDNDHISIVKAYHDQKKRQRSNPRETALNQMKIMDSVHIPNQQQVQVLSQDTAQHFDSNLQSYTNVSIEKVQPILNNYMDLDSRQQHQQALGHLSVEHPHQGLSIDQTNVNVKNMSVEQPKARKKVSIDHSNQMATTNLSMDHPKAQRKNLSQDVKQQQRYKQPSSINTFNQPQEMSPKSLEQIRRVHELVALYRCRFKQNASDAAVMGTLHSAASVIQIHFRYRKHLRESGLGRYKNKREQTQEVQSRKSEKNQSSNKNSTNRRNKSGLEYEQSSNVDLESLKKIKPRPNTTVSHENQSQSFILNNSSQGGRTPLIPGLDLGQINNPQVAVENKVEKQKKSDVNLDLLQLPKESPSSRPLKSISSFNSIFDKMGLPLTRSARVKIDFKLVQKDPKISEQIEEIIHYKQKKGAQIMKDAKQFQLISERTYEKNAKRLEKWVSASYNKINKEERPRGRSSRKQLVLTEDDLIQETQDNQIRLSNKINQLETRSGKPSARYSERSKFSQRKHNGISQRDDSKSDVNPYGEFLTAQQSVDKPIGSSRREKSKIVQMIDNSSRTSKKQNNKSNSDSIEEDKVSRLVDVQIDTAQSHNLDKQEIKDLMQLVDSREQADSDQDKNQDKISEKKESPSKPFVQISNHDIDDKNNQSDPSNNMNGSGSLSRESYDEVEQEQSIVDNTDSLKNILKEDEDQTLPIRSKENLNKNSDEDNNNQEDVLDLDDINIGEMMDNGQTDIMNQLNIAMENQIQIISEQVNKDSQAQSSQNSNKEGAFSKADEAQDDNPFEHLQNLVGHTQQDPEKIRDSNDLPNVHVIINNTQELKLPEENMMKLQLNSQHQHMAIKSSSQSATDNGSNLQSFKSSPKANREVCSSSSPSEMEREPAQSDQKAVIKEIVIQSNESSEQQSPVKYIKEENQKNMPPIQDIDKPALQVGIGCPVSPMSDPGQMQIQTGAHSLSSTDSNMTLALHNTNSLANQLESPPNILSPTNNKPLLNVVDQKEQKKEEEINLMVEDIVGYLYTQMLTDVIKDVEHITPRLDLIKPRFFPPIKYFEKKGIKTDLFAIEKYVEEIQNSVMETKDEFMTEIAKPLGKADIDQLFQMQNDDIGNFQHFHEYLRPVLPLDLYLKIEKRRKESRDPKNLKEGDNPDGLFDFEHVTDDDLACDRVDRGYLCEQTHIHNKVIFDCINDSLQQFRPYGKDGDPMQWSRQGRKIKPTEDFTMEEMFEITKHDLFRMAIMQAGTLPRREFVFGGQFDDELFAEIREKKLATLLVREIVETEPEWLKWDFEEAQTKIDLSDMILESLLSESIEFLQKKQQQQ